MNIKEILEKHALWLKNEGGERADLSGANLSDADLRYADLSDADLRYANLDYSCWPLWCGSLDVKADEALVGQLMFHAFELAKSSGVVLDTLEDVRKIIDKGSPIVKHGLKNPLGEGK